MELSFRSVPRYTIGLIALLLTVLLLIPVSAQAAGLSNGLPMQWCGQPTDTDLGGAPANSRPDYKVVYAYAAGEPNQFNELARPIQRSVAAMSRYFAWSAGGRKTIRFDMGTNCGVQYVDIQTVALKHPLYTYNNFPVTGELSENPALTELRATLGASVKQRRNYVVFMDGLSPYGQAYSDWDSLAVNSSAAVRAQAESSNPDTNPNNTQGGRFVVLYTPQGPPDHKYGMVEPDLMLRALVHTLGAVNNGAPHSTGAGHCYDGADLLCGKDDGPRGSSIQSVCGKTAFYPFVPLDCNQDDYFSPAPAPGSYLASHWNTYNSDYLGSCDELTVACGSGKAFVPFTIYRQSAGRPVRQQKDPQGAPDATNPTFKGGALGRASLKTALGYDQTVSTMFVTPLRFPAAKKRSVQIKACLYSTNENTYASAVMAHTGSDGSDYPYKCVQVTTNRQKVTVPTIAVTVPSNSVDYMVGDVTVSGSYVTKAGKTQSLGASTPRGDAALTSTLENDIPQI